MEHFFEEPEPKNFDDKIIICVDCSDEFVWNHGEQIFYSDRGLARPRRCPSCRAAKRERIEKIKRDGLLNSYEHQQEAAQ
jgi:hypothetical protein